MVPSAMVSAFLQSVLVGCTHVDAVYLGGGQTEVSLRAIGDGFELDVDGEISGLARDDLKDFVDNGSDVADRACEAQGEGAAMRDGAQVFACAEADQLTVGWSGEGPPLQQSLSIEASVDSDGQTFFNATVTFDVGGYQVSPVDASCTGDQQSTSGNLACSLAFSEGPLVGTEATLTLAYTFDEEVVVKTRSAANPHGGGCWMCE